METICIKIEENLLKKMNQAIKQGGYSTKTEFIREAIRKKVEEDEHKILVRMFLKTKGMIKRKISDKEFKKAREDAFEALLEERGLK